MSATDAVNTPTRFVELVEGVCVATSRWFETTTTVLLDAAGGAVVVDPAFLPDELTAIPADLQAMGVRCIGGLATHEHYDHVLWHADLGDVPRWSSVTTVQHLETERERLLAPLSEHLTPDLIDVAGRLVALPGAVLPWDGPTAECIEHDAHAPGHLALWLPASGVLVAGDMLSDVELPMPTDDETLENYAAGLERLRPAIESAAWLIPGHGSPTSSPLLRYDADMRYLADVMAGRASHDLRTLDPANHDLNVRNMQRARLA